jgi:hypothetical protein
LSTHNPETTPYWQLAATLHTQLQGRFFAVQAAVEYGFNKFQI